MKADQFIFSTVTRERVSSFSFMQLIWMLTMAVKQCRCTYAFGLYLDMVKIVNLTLYALLLYIILNF